MSVDKTFLLLRGRRPTREQQERLEELRKELGIADNDALWAVLVAHEYYLELYERVAEQFGKAAQKSRARASLVGSDTALIGLALAGQAAFGALCMFVGHRSSSHGPPAWMQPATSWTGVAGFVATILRVPAGWMAFALMLPAALAGLRWGVQLCRDGERLHGWALGTASTMLLVGCGTALWALCM